MRFYEGNLSRWRYTALLALVLVLQFGISTEVFATLAVVTVVVFLLAALLLEGPARLVPLAEYTALAYAAVAVVASPYLLHAFGGDSARTRATPRLPAHPRPREHPDPTQTTWLRPSSAAAITSRFTSGFAGSAAISESRSSSSFCSR